MPMGKGTYGKKVGRPSKEDKMDPKMKRLAMLKMKKAKKENMKLTPHFSLEEMVKSQTAARKGIPNVPTEAHIKAMEKLCLNVLEPVRIQYEIPFSPSSGYRSGGAVRCHRQQRQQPARKR